jgi:hypothetical protein
MHSRKSAVLSPACLGLAISQPGVAAESDGWQYKVPPYLLWDMVASGSYLGLGIRF